MTDLYDITVAGLGLMGAAALRYLSQGEGRILGIGPGEPAQWSSHPGVFASHYDQGRITRIMDPDPVWALLAKRSIAAYPALEKESGIQFHWATGGLRCSVDPAAPGDSLHQAAQTGRDLDALFTVMDRDDLARKFPFLSFPASTVGLWEEGEAGYVNPRSLVQAQLTAARKGGATVVRETVQAWQKEGDRVAVRTDSGATYYTRKLLICAGAYTGFLVPGLDIRPKLVSVLLAQVAQEEAQRLQAMPTLIHRFDGNAYHKSLYCLPPVRYPDGKMYIKIGGTAREPNWADSPEQIRGWFHTDGDREEGESLRGILQDLLPGFQAQSYHTRPCVLAYTAYDRPYIDVVDGDGPATGQIFVTAGGCGSAAKSSNEIGRLGAQLTAQGMWADPDLPAHAFTARFR